MLLADGVETDHGGVLESGNVGKERDVKSGRYSHSIVPGGLRVTWYTTDRKKSTLTPILRYAFNRVACQVNGDQPHGNGR